MEGVKGGKGEGVKKKGRREVEESGGGEGRSGGSEGRRVEGVRGGEWRE